MGFVLTGGVRVGEQLLVRALRAAALAPDRGEGHEEELLRGELLQPRARQPRLRHAAALRLEPVAVRAEGRLQATVVRHVLPERQRAVLVLAVDREAGVLIHEALRLDLERRAHVGRPPRLQVALAIILRTRVVETVGELVPCSSK